VTLRPGNGGCQAHVPALSSLLEQLEAARRDAGLTRRQQPGENLGLAGRDDVRLLPGLRGGFGIRERRWCWATMRNSPPLFLLIWARSVTRPQNREACAGPRPPARGRGRMSRFEQTRPSSFTRGDGVLAADDLRALEPEGLKPAPPGQKRDGLV